MVANLWNDGNLTQDSIDIAKYYGIRNDKNSTLYSGWPGISNCIDDYCDRFESEDEWCKSPNGSYDLGDTKVQLVRMSSSIWACSSTASDV